MLVTINVLLSTGLLIVIFGLLLKHPLRPSTILLVHLGLGVQLRALLLATGKISHDDALAPWAITSRQLQVSGFELNCATLIIVTILSLRLYHRPAMRALYKFIPNPPLKETSVVLGLSLFGLTCLTVYIALMARRIGSISDFAFAAATRSIAVFEGLGPLVLISELGIACAAGAFYAALRSKAPLSWITRIVLGASLLVALFTLALSGGRGNILLLLIVLTALWWEAKRSAGASKLRIYLVLGLMAALTGVVATVGLNIRSAAQQHAVSAKYSASSKISMMQAVSGGFALVDHYALSKAYTARHGHDFGAQYIRYPLFLVPRALWPGKPEALGFKIRREYWGDDLGGIPPSFFGETYIAFGLIGVLVGSVALGIACCWLDGFVSVTLVRSHYGKTVALWMLTLALFYNGIRSGMEIGFMKLTFSVCSLYGTQGVATFIIRLGNFFHPPKKRAPRRSTQSPEIDAGESPAA